MELWQIFGSRSEYLDTPLDEATRIKLALEAKWKIEDDNQKESEAELAAASER